MQNSSLKKICTKPGTFSGQKWLKKGSGSLFLHYFFVLVAIAFLFCNSPKHKNIFSAEDCQSVTTTTAASGGNREELLGQRPARRECRPRHDADAGCRNPISGGHSKSSSRFKGHCNAAAFFLSHLPHSVLDSKHFCERLPRRIDKAVRSCYVSIDKLAPYGALYTLFHHAVAAAERIKP